MTRDSIFQWQYQGREREVMPHKSQDFSKVVEASREQGAPAARGGPDAVVLLGWASKLHHRHSLTPPP